MLQLVLILLPRSRVVVSGDYLTKLQFGLIDLSSWGSHWGDGEHFLFSFWVSAHMGNLDNCSVVTRRLFWYDGCYNTCGSSIVVLVMLILILRERWLAYKVKRSGICLWYTSESCRFRCQLELLIGENNRSSTVCVLGASTWFHHLWLDYKRISYLYYLLFLRESYLLLASGLSIGNKKA